MLIPRLGKNEGRQFDRRVDGQSHVPDVSKLRSHLRSPWTHHHRSADAPFPNNEGVNGHSKLVPKKNQLDHFWHRTRDHR